MDVEPEVDLREDQKLNQLQLRKKLMKSLKSIVVASTVGTMLLLPGTLSANLIVNGDFELGDTGFTSQYTASANLSSGGEGAGEGLYGIGTNPQSFHPSFVSVGDHTTTTGNMMVVNGSSIKNTVWSQTVVPPLVSGNTYLFSAWVMNVFPDSPANLQFSFGGNSLGTITPTGNGVWQQFTASFIAGSDSTGGLIDLNIAAHGNDFAVDDISLTAVPEATTVFAGVLMLLPLGASALRILRRKMIV